MTRARFVAAAPHEFLAEVVYYNKEEPGVGARIAAAVEDATARALSFPLSGSPATKNTRKVFLKDFPFAVVYRPETDRHGKTTVTRQRERQGYRQSRVQDR